MYYDELATTMEHLLQDDKGILAADESIGTIGKRFDLIKVANTEQNRFNYRLLLANTQDLENYINAVILFEETFNTFDGKNVANIFAAKDIIPGIKVDRGLVNLPNTNDEKITQGLDDLSERLLKYKTLGAKFAKWRNVYLITSSTPSLTAIKSGAEILARYAATCQSLGIVPIVEPEVLINGDHSIDHCAEATEIILHELFKALFMHQVELEMIILKPSMITCGKNHQPFNTPEEIAEYTISVFRNTVPAAVPSINFLSGGQTAEQATINLNAINSVGEQPWNLNFSYGRALQDQCLQIWQGQENNVQLAQQTLLKRAKLNSAACLGKYTKNMEK